MKHHNNPYKGNNVAHDFKNLGETLEENVEEILPDAAIPFAKRAVEYGQKTAIDLAQDLHGLGKVGKRLGDAGWKKARQMEKSLERNIKANKGTYLMAIAGLGLLAGAALIGRRKA